MSASWLQRSRESRITIACTVALTLFVDMLVYGVVIPCLPMLVIERLGGDSTMVGLLFGVYAFGLLLSTPIFSILSDRYQNRRYPTLAGMLGLVVSTLAFAYADNYSLLIIARVCQGVAGGASWTIGLAMLADVFPVKRLGVIMGTVLTAHTVGFAIGPAIGGLLYEYGGFGAPFYFCAGFAVINFLAILWIEEPLLLSKKIKLQHQQHPDDEGTSLLQHNDHTKYTDQEHIQHKKSSSPSTPEPSSVHPPSSNEKEITIIDLIKNWRILSCVLCVIVSASVFSGIEPALPVHLQKVYQCSASTIGFIFVAMVVPAFLAPVIGHFSDKIGRTVITASGLILMAIASPFVSLIYPSVYLIIPSLMIFGFSSPLTLTPILPEMGEAVNDLGSDVYAQVYALYNMAYASGMFLGPVFAGYIMTHYGFRFLMVAFSLALIACSPIMIDWFALWRKFLNKVYYRSI
ncbi:unnamed protein product [Cunninghamella blakesleeana]